MTSKNGNPTLIDHRQIVPLQILIRERSKNCHHRFRASGIGVTVLRFTDNHPDVIATRQQLERLYAQRKEELAVLAAAGGSEFEKR